MPFPDSVLTAAYRRSGGRCECQRSHSGIRAPHQGGRCPTMFIFRSQWEGNHVVSQAAGGPDTYDNCEILCITCHQLTRSFGTRL